VPAKPRERRLRLEGPVNFRDLGGYAGADGRRVRWGRLFRSDNLETLTATDVAALDALGVRLVCDLRRDAERTATTSVLHGVRVQRLPIGDLAAETRTMARRVMRGEISEVGVDTMAGVYLTILRLHADSFGTVVANAGDAANLPMIVHCTAGKDRTGVASALLLAALGVEDEDVLADYELSTEYHSIAKIAEVRPRLEAAGVDFSKVETFWSAPRGVMAATLAGLRAEHGSVEAYLTGPAGVPVSRLEALRAALLEEPLDNQQPGA
jgi:protein-tyrosine phosphatase